MERKQHFKAMLPRAMQGHHRPAPLGSALEREPGGGAFSQVSCVCVCVCVGTKIVSLLSGRNGRLLHFPRLERHATLLGKGRLAKLGTLSKTTPSGVSPQGRMRAKKLDGVV